LTGGLMAPETSYVHWSSSG